MIGEEWGLIGVLVLISLYTAVILVGFRIAARAPDLFGEETPPPEERAPLYKKWWVWTAVGAVVATGTVLLFTTGGDRVNDVDPTFGRFRFEDF